MNTRRLGVLLGSLLLSAPVLALTTAPAHAAADCVSGVESDFNGDGRSDAAVADPYATVDGLAEAGRVVVFYGDADGRVGEGARGVVQQGSGSVGGVPESLDRFGFALAAADIDCDGYSDLVVGTPYEDLSGQVDSGYAQVVFGSAAGLGNGEDSRQFSATNFGHAIHAGDQLGYAVDAAEDVEQGGTPAPDAYAIAIGVPGGDVAGKNNAGWVGFVAALDGGSALTSVNQQTPGIPGAAEAGDRFGAAVSLNYLTGSAGTIDAVVGVPNEDIGSIADAGSITVITDIYDDEPAGGQGFDQGSPGVSGDPEKGDQFGQRVDSVRVGGTTRIAVGVAHEDIGSAGDAGSVQLFTSNATSITATTAFSQDTSGVGGVAEKGDLFGDRLAFAVPGPGASSTRLAVGVPGEDGVAVNNGLVQVFPVTSLGSEVGYGQDSPGVPGTPQAGDKFGSAVAVVTGNTEQVLLVGVPNDVTETHGVVDAIPLGGGSPRAWVPGLGGVPSGGASGFGSAISSGGQQ